MSPTRRRATGAQAGSPTEPTMAHRRRWEAATAPGIRHLLVTAGVGVFGVLVGAGIVIVSKGRRNDKSSPPNHAAFVASRKANDPAPPAEAAFVHMDTTVSAVAPQTEMESTAVSPAGRRKFTGKARAQESVARAVREHARNPFDSIVDAFDSATRRKALPAANPFADLVGRETAGARETASTAADTRTRTSNKNSRSVGSNHLRNGKGPGVAVGEFGCFDAANQFKEVMAIEQTNAGGLGELVVENGSSRDAIVTLLSSVAPFGSVAERFYIPRSLSARISGIPAGSYRMRVATGLRYSATRRAFCGALSAFEFDQPLQFDEETTPSGIRYSEQRITLHKVRNGKATTHAIDPILALSVRGR